jgi:hypothetical protein
MAKLRESLQMTGKELGSMHRVVSRSLAIPSLQCCAASAQPQPQITTKRRRTAIPAWLRARFCRHQSATGGAAMKVRGTLVLSLATRHCTMALLVLVAACSGDSDGEGRGGNSANACAESCIALQSSCQLEATRDRDAKVAACSGSSEDVTACRDTADRVLASAESVCTNARSACTTCCSSQGSACASIAPEVPKFAGTFRLPDRRDLQTLDLPPGPKGTGFMLGELPDGVAWFDPALRTPVTAAAECASAVLACFEPQQRNFAGCFASVPVCPTDSPWTAEGPACCAAACPVRYQELRRQGRDEPTAMAAAIWEAPSCMPGVEGHVPE